MTKAILQLDVDYVQSAPSLPVQIANFTMKRTRSLSDVDGAGTSMFQSKKQRLHLQLFTSRLSSPYAAPSSYIVGRGESKIAVWAKQKGFATKIREGNLRRVAGVNRVRMQFANENCAGGASRPSEKVMLAPGQSQSPDAESIQSIVMSQSPLGISNYAAIDDEDLSTELEHFEPDSNDKDEIYSDFNVLDPVERDSTIAAEEDLLHSVFTRVPFEMSLAQLQREEQMADEVVDAADRPPSPPEFFREVLRENERQGQMSFTEL